MFCARVAYYFYNKIVHYSPRLGSVCYLYAIYPGSRLQLSNYLLVFAALFW